MGEFWTVKFYNGDKTPGGAHIVECRAFGGRTGEGEAGAVAFADSVGRHKLIEICRWPEPERKDLATGEAVARGTAADAN